MLVVQSTMPILTSSLLFLPISLILQIIARGCIVH